MIADNTPSDTSEKSLLSIEKNEYIKSMIFETDLLKDLLDKESQVWSKRVKKFSKLQNKTSEELSNVFEKFSAANSAIA